MFYAPDKRGLSRAKKFRRKKHENHKKLLVLLLALCCISSTITPSYAAKTRPTSEITYDAKAILSISSDGQALCAVIVRHRCTLARPSLSMEGKFDVKIYPQSEAQGTPKPLDASSAYCAGGRTFVVQPVFQGAGERTLASMRSTASQLWKILQFPLDKPSHQSYTSCYGEYLGIKLIG